MEKPINNSNQPVNVPFGIRHFENFHIFLWLIKDSCWMMEWKIAGTIAFFPTIAMAVFICIRTIKKGITIWANLAVLSWILANSSWMFAEFYQFPSKNTALLFFISGLGLISWYIYQVLVKKIPDDVN